jgi:hypothetical protein
VESLDDGLVIVADSIDDLARSDKEAIEQYVVPPKPSLARLSLTIGQDACQKLTLSFDHTWPRGVTALPSLLRQLSYRPDDFVIKAVRVPSVDSGGLSRLTLHRSTKSLALGTSKSHFPMILEMTLAQ